MSLKTQIYAITGLTMVIVSMALGLDGLSQFSYVEPVVSTNPLHYLN